ncbi:hypothetical protein SKAU_G00305620 [Synaphobranchus kaupii]|uniref:Uncharacterized protein n=1 Tax=Synaphobranchus kaupii TaxID=118154 RepID=A0A9Q1EQQ4_SYNKA|nr:hypothetical protein SKAU_G00305620 [Synaphobranchus kaupii]
MQEDLMWTCLHWFQLCSVLAPLQESGQPSSYFHNDRVQEELSQVIGVNEPELKDQKDLHYTNAVIHESHRLIPPLSLIYRSTARDATFQGYFIQKGTMVFLSQKSLLLEEGEWETPDRFNPGHFLDEKGCFTRKDYFLAFSAGTVHGKAKLYNPQFMKKAADVTSADHRF